MRKWWAPRNLYGICVAVGSLLMLEVFTRFVRSLLWPGCSSRVICFKTIALLECLIYGISTKSNNNCANLFVRQSGQKGDFAF